jgi:hypothetical protein
MNRSKARCFERAFFSGFIATLFLDGLGSVDLTANAEGKQVQAHAMTENRLSG